jgi:hypothetical protein
MKLVISVFIICFCTTQTIAQKKSYDKQMNKLTDYLMEVERNIPALGKQQGDISAANVGWHLEHILLTIDRVIDSLNASDPTQYKYSFKPVKTIVFLAGAFPRGRAKAPAAVVPETYDEESLRKHLMTTRLNMEALSNVDADRFFNHLIFGNLKTKKTVKFLGIHTNHHLKIIYDIVKDSKWDKETIITRKWY